MAGRAGMLTGMPVRRAIAAKGGAAFLAGAKMNPVGTDLHALFAFMALRKADRFDCVEV